MESSGHKVFVGEGSRGNGATVVRRFSAVGAAVVFTYAASADAAIQLATETAAQAIRADAGERDFHTIDGGFAA